MDGDEFELDEVSNSMLMMRLGLEDGYANVDEDEKNSHAKASIETSKKARKRTSHIWKHFDIVESTVSGIINLKAVCKYCSAELGASSQAGTGHLKCHTDSCLEKIPNSNCK